jgi:hypothetical protein
MPTSRGVALEGFTTEFMVSRGRTLQEQRNPFHMARLGEFLVPFNAAMSSRLKQARAFFYQQTGDPAGSQQMALQALADIRQQPAASCEVFWVAAVASMGLVFLVIPMKRWLADFPPTQMRRQLFRTPKRPQRPGADRGAPAVPARFCSRAGWRFEIHPARKATRHWRSPRAYNG